MQCYYCGNEISLTGANCPNCQKKIGTNAEILNAAQAKEEKAIAYLYNLTYNNVYQAIRPLIKDEDTALDILQDTYIKAFNSLAQLENAELFRAWVKKIAQNKSKDWLKKKKPTLFSQMKNNDDDNEVDFVDDRVYAQPEAVVDNNENRRLLWDIIDSLSDAQRLVVNMFYFQEMSVKEIAQELDVSENTVKSRLNYARKTIESQVLTLEKKGTKLYSLAPIPFLLWLFSSSTESASATTLSAITTTLGCGAASSAAVGAQTAASSGSTMATAATTSGSSMAGAAGASIATKVVVGIVATSIAIGGGTAIYKATTSNTPTAITSTRNPETTQEEDIPQEEISQSIAPIITYVDLVETLGSGANDANKYLLYDINQDGVSELLCTVSPENDFYEQNTFIFAKDKKGTPEKVYENTNTGGRVPYSRFEILTYMGQQFLAYSYSDSYFSGSSPEFFLGGEYHLLDINGNDIKPIHKIMWNFTSNFESNEIYDVIATIDGDSINGDDFISMYNSAFAIFDDAMTYDVFLETYKDK